MGVETGIVAIVNKGGGDRNIARVRAREFGNVESSEAGFKLVFKMGFVLGSEIIFFGDSFKKGNKNSDVIRVFRCADFKTFFRGAAPILDIGFTHVFEDFIFGSGEVDSPGRVRVDMTSFLVAEGFQLRIKRRIRRFDTDKKGVLFLGKESKGFGGVFERGAG